MFQYHKYIVISLFIAGAAYIGVSYYHDVRLTPDSATYIIFQAHRTAGYPIFLNALGVTTAVRLQPLLYVLALLFLWRELSLTVKGHVLPSVCVLLCFINPEVNSYHNMVMTESLFMTLSIFMIVFIVRFLSLPTLSSAALASLFAALAAIVRPTGYAFFPALFLLAVFRWRLIEGHRLAFMAAALLPAILICGIERAGSKLYHGAEETGMVGPHLYAKAALLDAPAATPPADPHKVALQKALESDFAPIRQIVSEIPRWEVREVISEFYENCLEYDCSASVKDSLGLPLPAVNRLSGEVALTRIENAPEAFALLVWDRYRSLWTLYQATHPANLPALRTFLDQHRPMPFESGLQRDSPEFRATMPPSQLAVFVQPGILVIGALTLMLGVSGLAGACYRILETRLAASSLLSLALHGSMLLTAVSALGLRRFTFGLWPMMMAALILAVSWTYGFTRSHAKSRLEQLLPAGQLENN